MLMLQLPHKGYLITALVIVIEWPRTILISYLQTYLFLQVTLQNWIACCLVPWTWKTSPKQSWRWLHSSRRQTVACGGKEPSNPVSTTFSWTQGSPKICRFGQRHSVSEHITSVYSAHIVCTCWNVWCMFTVCTMVCVCSQYIYKLPVFVCSDSMHAVFVCVQCAVCFCNWFCFFSSVGLLFANKLASMRG